MKGNYFRWVPFLLFSYLGPSSICQVNISNLFQKPADSLDLKQEAPSFFSSNISFVSETVFLGRKDSVQAPYFYPSVTYHHKSGFYGGSSFSYSVPNQQIDVILINAGFGFAVKKIDADLSFTKYFFNEESNNVISEIIADVTASLNYNFNIARLSVTGSYYFNMEESDLVLSTEVSHDFISNNKKLQISPAVGLYFGSQTFYEQYVITKGGTQGQGNGSPSIANGKIIEAEVFNLMAIDFSIPFWYEHKSFSFLVLPTYVLPKNNIKYAVDDIIYEEKVSETLYWILGINYKL